MPECLIQDEMFKSDDGEYKAYPGFHLGLYKPDEHAHLEMMKYIQQPPTASQKIPNLAVPV